MEKDKITMEVERTQREVSILKKLRCLEAAKVEERLAGKEKLYSILEKIENQEERAKRKQRLEERLAEREKQKLLDQELMKLDEFQKSYLEAVLYETRVEDEQEVGLDTAEANLENILEIGEEEGEEEEDLYVSNYIDFIEKKVQKHDIPEDEIYNAIIVQHKYEIEKLEEYDRYYITHYLLMQDSSSEFSSIISVISSTEEEEEEDSEVHYPLTKMSRAGRRYCERQQKAWEECQARENIEKKLNDLYKIKKQMEDDWYSYHCHKSERSRRRMLKREQIIAKLNKNVRIDLTKPFRGRDAVIDRYILFEQQKSELRKKQVEQKIAILKKLLVEEKKKCKDNFILERGKYMILPRYERKKKVIPPSASRQRESPKALEELYISEDLSSDESMKDELKEKGGKGKKDKSKKKKEKHKTEKKEKKGKKNKSKEDKKEKGSKKHYKGKEMVEEPPASPPIREVIEDRNIFLSEIVDDFRDVPVTEESSITESLPQDLGFSCKPRLVLFKNFEADQVYLKNVVVTNTSLHWVNCRSVGLQLNDVLQEEFFEVDTVYSCKLFSGMSFQVAIKFTPNFLTQSALGEVTFETDRGPNTERKTFCIPIKCCPKQPDIPQPSVGSEEINFSSVSYWNGDVFKTLKLINSGGGSCFANIQKVKEESTTIEDTITDVQAIENLNIDKSLETSEVEELTNKSQASDMGSIPERTKLLSSRKSVKSLSKGGIAKSILNTSEKTIKASNLTIVEEPPQDPSSATMEFAKEIVEECFNDVFEVFRFEKKHCITVPPRSNISLKVWFGRHSPGLYYEKFTVLFEDEFNNCISQFVIPFLGEIVPFPLTLEPVVADMGICVFDSSVVCKTFQVHNPTNMVVALNSRVPSSVKKHVVVTPHHVFASPQSYTTFTIKLQPRWNLTLEAQMYYDAETEILDFPVTIIPQNTVLGKCPKLQMFVLAIVTDPYAIVLTPAKCELGQVTTLETVRQKLTLTNNCKISQKFCFEEIPACVQIQPGNGVGEILPGQELQLELLYSPRLCDITGNGLLAKSGLEGEHQFTVKCTTIYTYEGPATNTWGEQRLKSLAERRKYQQEKRDMVVPYREGSCSFDFASLSPEPSKKQLNKGLISKTFENLSGLINESSLSLYAIYRSSKTFEEKNEINNESKMKKLPDNRLETNVIECVAHIIDPLCELSAKQVIFPMTPCFSVSKMDIYLETENKTSATDCRCGVLPPIGKLEKKLHIWFQFKTECTDVIVEPSSGYTVSGRHVKISLTFKPELKMEDVKSKAQMLKAEQIIKEKKEELMNKASSKKKQPKKDKQKKKKSKERSEADNALEVTVDPDTLKVESQDLFSAEKCILQAFEPYSFKTVLECFVWTAATDDDDEPRRMEVHRLEITCPVGKPDFILECSSQHFCFGAVAVGTRSRQYLKLRNLKVTDIIVSLSLLNPLGPFFCPFSTVRLAPEHILTLPVTFGPTEECQQIVEYFEVKSGYTSMTLMASGWGVNPEYTVSPDFLIYRFQVKSSKGANCSIEISNKCSAPLPFKMDLVFVKQAEDKSQEQEETINTPESKKGKKETPNKKKPKPPKKMDIEMSPEEQESLDKEFTDAGEEVEEMFTLSGLSNTNELIVPPFSKASLKITFAIPQPPKQNKENKKETSSMEKNRSKITMESVEQPNMKYVAKYNLFLGKIVFVKEYIFMAFVSYDQMKKKK